MQIPKWIRFISRFIPDKIYIQLQYRYLTGRELNLSSPTRFNEKLQWIKLYDRNPLYVQMSDKYLAKVIVSQKIGEQYVIPLLGVWSDPNSISFNELPLQFVLKTNHDSKGVVICKDKTQFDFDSAKKVLSEHLAQSGYYYGREWPYKGIERKIIAEKYLEDDSGGLRDYKVLCFGGVPKLIQVHHGRFTDKHTQDFYDTNWIRQSFNQINEKSSNAVMKKPVFLGEMLRLSALLSVGIPHVRVDWYYTNNQLFFGEFTFFDSSGYVDFVPDDVNVMLGNWLELPSKMQ